MPKELRAIEPLCYNGGTLTFEILGDPVPAKVRVRRENAPMYLDDEGRPTFNKTKRKYIRQKRHGTGKFLFRTEDGGESVNPVSDDGTKRREPIKEQVTGSYEEEIVDTWPDGSEKITMGRVTGRLSVLAKQKDEAGNHIAYAGDPLSVSNEDVSREVAKRLHEVFAMFIGELSESTGIHASPAAAKSAGDW